MDNAECYLVFEDFIVKEKTPERENIILGTEEGKKFNLKKSIYQCLTCEKKFRHMPSLRRHIRNDHETSEKFTCHYCERDFRSKMNITYHIINVHLQPKNVKCSITCFKCEAFFASLLHLINHLKISHKLLIEKQRIQFNTINEFKIWKETMEASTNARYRVLRSQRTAYKGVHVKYVCNRSGSKYQRIRKTSFDIPRKIGHYCTSHIYVYILNGCVDGYFYPTHTPHGIDQCYLPLTNSDEKYIFEKLKSGFTCKQIVQDIQSNSTYNRRKNMITYNRIYNIARKYKIINYENDRKLALATTKVPVTPLPLLASVADKILDNNKPNDSQTNINMQTREDEIQLNDVSFDGEISDLLVAGDTEYFGGSNFIKDLELNDDDLQLINEINDHRINGSDNNVLLSTTNIGDNFSASVHVTSQQSSELIINNASLVWEILKNNHRANRRHILTADEHVNLSNELFRQSEITNKTNLILEILKNVNMKLDEDKSTIINQHLDAMLKELCNVNIVI